MKVSDEGVITKYLKINMKVMMGWRMKMMTIKIVPLIVVKVIIINDGDEDDVYDSDRIL